ncbi:MAG TPA: cytochrome c3 family protein [Labilithrix sp.]|nr:cytochrome c3 family protein [Labilithrix sp.]
MTAPPGGPMKPLAPSSMEAQLRDIGVDPAALPPLNKLDAKTLRDVMNTFTKALGVKCNHCHEKDFKAPTERKKIATHMWNDFTRALAVEGGGALYCDSCHGGRAQFLDRRDLGALGHWMQDNFVDKMKRADKKDHSCDTCHGDPFEGKILTKLWR